MEKDSGGGTVNTGASDDATSNQSKETKDTTDNLQRNKKAANVVVNFADAIKQQTASMAKKAEEIKKNSGLVVNFADAIKSNVNLGKLSQSLQKSSGMVINKAVALKNNSTALKLSGGIKSKEPDTPKAEPQKDQSTPKDKSTELVKTLVVDFDKAIEDSTTKIAKYGEDGKLVSVVIKDGEKNAPNATQPAKKEDKQQKPSPALQKNKKAPTLVVDFAAAVQKQTKAFAKVAEEKKKAGGLLVDFEQAMRDEKAQLAKIAEEKKKKEQEQADKGKSDVNVSDNKDAQTNQKEEKPKEVKQLQVKTELDKIMGRVNTIIGDYEKDSDKKDAKVANVEQVPKSNINPTTDTLPTFLQDNDAKADFKRNAKASSVVVNFAEAVQKKTEVLAEKAKEQQKKEAKEEKKQNSVLGRVKKAVTGESDWANVLNKHESKDKEKGTEEVGLLEEYIRGERRAYNKPKPIKEIIKEREKQKTKVPEPMKSPLPSQENVSPVLPKKNDSMTTLVEGFPSEIAINHQEGTMGVSTVGIRGLDDTSDCEENKPKSAGQGTSLPEDMRRKIDGMTCDEIVDFMVKRNTNEDKIKTTPAATSERAVTKDSVDNREVFPASQSVQMPKQVSGEKIQGSVKAYRKEIPLDTLLQDVDKDKDFPLYAPTRQAERKSKAEEKKRNDVLQDSLQLKKKEQALPKPERKEIPLDTLLLDVDKDKDFPLYAPTKKASNSGDTSAERISETKKKANVASQEPFHPKKTVQDLARSDRKEIPLEDLLLDLGQSKDDFPLVGNKGNRGEVKSADEEKQKSGQNVSLHLEEPGGPRSREPEKLQVHTIPKRRTQKKEVDPCDIGSEDICDYLDKLVNNGSNEKASTDAVKNISQRKQELRKSRKPAEEDDICDYLEKLAENLDRKTKQAQQQLQSASYQDRQAIARDGDKDKVISKKNDAPISTPTQQGKTNFMDELFGNGKENGDQKDNIFNTTREKSQKYQHGVKDQLETARVAQKKDESYVMSCVGEMAQTRGRSRNPNPSVKENLEFKPNQTNDGLLDIERDAGVRGREREARRTQRGRDTSEELGEGMSRSRKGRSSPKETAEVKLTKSDDGLLDIERLAGARGRDRGLVARKSQPVKQDVSLEKPGIEELAHSRRQRPKVTADKRDDDISWLTAGSSDDKAKNITQKVEESNNSEELGLEKLARARSQNRKARPTPKEKPEQVKMDDGLLDIERLAGARGRDRGLAARRKQTAEPEVREEKLSLEEMAQNRQRRPLKTSDKKDDDMSWLTTEVRKEKVEKQITASEKFGDMSWMTNVKRKEKEVKAKVDEGISGDMSWLTKEDGKMRKPETKPEKTSEPLGDMSWLTKSNDVPEKCTTDETVVKSTPGWLQNDANIDTSTPAPKEAEKATPSWLQQPNTSDTVAVSAPAPEKSKKPTPSWLKDPSTTPETVKDTENTDDIPKLESNVQTLPWLQNTKEQTEEDIVKIPAREEPKSTLKKKKEEPTKITADIDSDWDKAFNEMFDKNKKGVADVPDGVPVPIAQVPSQTHVPQDVPEPIAQVPSPTDVPQNVPKPTVQVPHSTDIPEDVPEPIVQVPSPTDIPEDVPDTIANVGADAILEDASNTYALAPEAASESRDKVIAETERKVIVGDNEFNTAEKQNGMPNGEAPITGQCDGSGRIQPETGDDQETVSLVRADNIEINVAECHLPNETIDLTEGGNSSTDFIEGIVQMKEASKQPIKNVRPGRREVTDGEIQPMKGDSKSISRKSKITESKDSVRRKAKKKLILDVNDNQDVSIMNIDETRTRASDLNVADNFTGIDNIESTPPLCSDERKHRKKKSKKYAVKEDPRSSGNKDAKSEAVSKRKTSTPDMLVENQIHDSGVANTGSQNMENMLHGVAVAAQVLADAQAKLKESEASYARKIQKKEKHRLRKLERPQEMVETIVRDTLQECRIPDRQSSHMENMLVEIAATADKLAEAKAELKKEKQARKYKRREVAQEKEKTFADILDDEMVSLMTHGGYEPKPEKYRSYPEENAALVNPVRKPTHFHPDNVTASPRSGRGKSKKKKDAAPMPRSSYEQVNEMGDQKQFGDIDAMCRHANEELCERRQRPVKAQKGKVRKVKRYSPDETEADEKPFQVKTCDPCINRCHNCGCHSPHVEPQVQDTHGYSKAEKTYTHIPNQHVRPIKPTPVYPGTISVTGERNIVMTEPEDRNPVTVHFGGAVNVAGNFYCGTQEKKQGTKMSKLKNAFKKLRIFK